LMEGFQPQIWDSWRLVGTIEPRKVLDLAGSGLFVQAFGVARLAHLQRGIDKNFQKIAGTAPLLDQLANGGPIGAIGADKCGERDYSPGGEQPRNRADAADIFCTVLGAEAQAETIGIGLTIRGEHGRRGVETMANIVAVEEKTVDTPLVEQVIDEVGDGALARARQAREPHHAAAMPVETLALVAGDSVLMP